VAVRQNLEFALGETWQIAITCNDASGAPLDLTGGYVECVISGGPSPILLSNRAGGSGVEIGNATAGEAVVELIPSAQSGLTEALLQYEIRATLSSGTVSDQAYGSIYARAGLF
jgi:hypothetical protein